MLIEWIVGVLYAVLSMFGKVVYMIETYVSSDNLK
mgnify:CR=1 FL=1|jgi:hypothetical protein